MSDQIIFSLGIKTKSRFFFFMWIPPHLPVLILQNQQLCLRCHRKADQSFINFNIYFGKSLYDEAAVETDAAAKSAPPSFFLHFNLQDSFLESCVGAD